MESLLNILWSSNELPVSIFPARVETTETDFPTFFSQAVTRGAVGRSWTSVGLGIYLNCRIIPLIHLKGNKLCAVECVDCRSRCQTMVGGS